MYKIRNYTILCMGLQLGPIHYGKNRDLRMFENSAKRRMFEKGQRKQQGARGNCIRRSFIIWTSF